MLDGEVVDSLDVRRAEALIDGGTLDPGSSRSSAPRSRRAARRARREIGQHSGRAADVTVPPARRCSRSTRASPSRSSTAKAAWLIADDGRRYLDCIAGIAVVSLGHCHPAPLEAAKEQLERLWHVSNLYSTEPMEHLAEQLSDRFGGAQAFYCNSGTEAVEAAIKWARKATGTHRARRARGLVPRPHDGRALDHRPAGEARAVRAARARRPLRDARRRSPTRRPDDTARDLARAGAGRGRRPAARAGDARDGARARRRVRRDARLRRGADRHRPHRHFYAWQQLGVRPDALTLAKGLANGLPIGALLVADGTPSGFVPGDHASTFGGNPVSCAAACAVVDAIDDDLLAHVREIGARFEAAFDDVRGARPAARARARPAGRARSRPRRSSTACSSAPPATPRCA